MTQATHPTPGKPLSDGWIEWTGGENPVPGQRVDVRFPDGEEDQNVPSEFWACDGVDWWNHDSLNPSQHIIAYRIARPTPVGGDQEAQPSTVASGWPRRPAPVAWRVRQLHYEIDGAITGWQFTETLPKPSDRHRWEIQPLYAQPSEQTGGGGV